SDARRRVPDATKLIHFGGTKLIHPRPQILLVPAPTWARSLAVGGLRRCGGGRLGRGVAAAHTVALAARGDDHGPFGQAVQQGGGELLVATEDLGPLGKRQ